MVLYTLPPGGQIPCLLGLGRTYSLLAASERVSWVCSAATSVPALGLRPFVKRVLSFRPLLVRIPWP